MYLLLLQFKIHNLFKLSSSFAVTSGLDMSDNGTNVSVNMLVLTHQRPLSSSSFRWENTWTQADSKQTLVHLLTSKLENLPKFHIRDILDSNNRCQSSCVFFASCDPSQGFTSDRIIHSPVAGLLELLLWFCLLATGWLRVVGGKLPCYSHILTPVKDLQRKIHYTIFIHLTMSSNLFLNLKPSFLQRGIYGVGRIDFLQKQYKLVEKKCCSTGTLK